MPFYPAPSSIQKAKEHFKQRLGDLKKRLPSKKKLLLLAACLILVVLIMFIAIRIALVNSTFLNVFFGPLIVLCLYSFFKWLAAKMKRYMKKDKKRKG